MPVLYKIIPGLKAMYVSGKGKVSVEEIITEGARMFSDNEWRNGYKIMIDYRGITEFDVKTDDVMKIVNQDKSNEYLFDKSKCAIIACSDLVFGISRMWEALSGNKKTETMVFRDIDEAMEWLEVDETFLNAVRELQCK